MTQLYYDLTDLYRDLLRELGEQTDPYRYLTLQFCFILYLLLGQLLLLLVWRILTLRSPGEPSRLGRFVFALYILLAQVVLFAAWPMLAGLWLSADKILLADIVVTIHLAIVLAVLLTLVLVVVGWPLDWRWTRHFWFRLGQLIVIEIVAGQKIVGIECPLITVERELRGGRGYLHQLETASALGAMCNKILYVPNQQFILIVVYSIAALLVLLTWILVPPRLPWRTNGDAAGNRASQEKATGRADPEG